MGNNRLNSAGSQGVLFPVAAEDETMLHIPGKGEQHFCFSISDKWNLGNVTSGLVAACDSVQCPCCATTGRYRSACCGSC